MKTLLKRQILITAIATTLLTGCFSGKTITSNNTGFFCDDDPICEIIDELCYDFGVFGVADTTVFVPYAGCNVALTFNPEKSLTTNVKVTSNETGDVIYERSLSIIDDETFKAKFELYNIAQNHLLADFSGVVYMDASKSIDEEQMFNDALIEDDSYHTYIRSRTFDNVVSGDLKFYSKNDGAKKTSVIKHVKILADNVIITEYWPNGQKRLIKEYNREDKDITAASNYNDDGSQGNPMELAFLLNDQWIGFTGDKYNLRLGTYYLILRAKNGDWRHGRVFMCMSKSECQQDYAMEAEGYYEIDDSSITLYRMNVYAGGGWSSAIPKFNMSIKGHSITDITISGIYRERPFCFESNLDMNKRSWLKSSLISRFDLN